MSWASRLPPRDPELIRTWQLFVETWREGKALVDSGEVDDDLDWECQARNDPGHR